MTVALSRNARPAAYVPVMAPNMAKALSMATLLGSLLLSACSVVGIRNGTEEPPHSLVERLGNVEIRRYAPRTAAETTVPGDAYSARGEGFRRLAGYIFGGNQGRVRIDMTAPVAQSGAPAGAPAGAPPGEPIAMTAPVAQASDAEGWVIRFFLPAGLADAPKPNDGRVRIVPVPAETVAVLRFGGLASDTAIAAQRATLLATLAGTRWRPAADPVTWFYDPPWTLPPLRRNEIAVPVAEAAK